MASLTTTMVTDRGTVHGGLIQNLQFKYTVIHINNSTIYVKHNVQAMATKESFHVRKTQPSTNKLDSLKHNKSTRGGG